MVEQSSHVIFKIIALIVYYSIILHAIDIYHMHMVNRSPAFFPPMFAAFISSAKQ